MTPASSAALIPVVRLYDFFPPNGLTILRILLIPIFVILMGNHERGGSGVPYIALAVFLLAILTDALDGYIARRYNKKTKLGSILDPIADKALINTAFVCLYFSHTMKIDVPQFVPVIVIFRDLVIIVGSIVIFMTMGCIEARPTVIGKATAALQMLTVACVLSGFGFAYALLWITIVVTLVSMAEYVLLSGRIINGRQKV